MIPMYELTDKVSFGFSAENPEGKKNGGTRGKDCEKLNAYLTIAPGESRTICDADGPGMITHTWFTGSISHSMILRIFWDGNESPSVETPLSAFFGMAYDENPADVEGRYPTLNSALILLSPGRSGNSYFEMPFKKHCRITVENRSQEEAILYYMIEGWYGALPQAAGYFHAAYHAEHPVQKGHAYTVLEHVKGKGRFLGMTLAVGVNGHNTCWVEGEAKIYLDGDQYPTINYTGTEDYFCGSYAFGNDMSLHHYQTYNGLYAGMYSVLGDTSEMYNAQKRFLLYRFHVADPIFFQESFRMTMDNLGWSGPRYDDYTSVAYYYLDTPESLPWELPEDAELRMC